MTFSYTGRLLLAACLLTSLFHVGCVSSRITPFDDGKSFRIGARNPTLCDQFSDPDGCVERLRPEMRRRGTFVCSKAPYSIHSCKKAPDGFVECTIQCEEGDVDDTMAKKFPGQPFREEVEIQPSMDFDPADDESIEDLESDLEAPATQPSTPADGSSTSDPIPAELTPDTPDAGNSEPESQP